MMWRRVAEIFFVSAARRQVHQLFLRRQRETSSRRWRPPWPVNSSKLPPAASATIPNRSGNASTTERHCRPIEPVEPKMDSCFKEKSFLRFALTCWDRPSVCLPNCSPDSSTYGTASCDRNVCPPPVGQIKSKSNSTRQLESPKSAHRSCQGRPRAPAT